MSDLNDLIHTNAVIAYKQGVERERERIIKIIEKRRDYDCSSALCKIHGLLCIYCKADNELIELIKGEQK